MKSELSLTVVLRKSGKWYIAFCPEVPSANGQGETKEEAINDLKEAILFLWEDQREDMMKGVPSDATCETLSLT